MRIPYISMLEMNIIRVYDKIWAIISRLQTLIFLYSCYSFFNPLEVNRSNLFIINSVPEILRSGGFLGNHLTVMICVFLSIILAMSNCKYLSKILSKNSLYKIIYIN